MSHDRVLVATSGTEPAKRALTEVIDLADALDADLHAIYVLEVAEPPPWFDDPEIVPGVDTNAGAALDDVASQADEKGFDAEVVTAVLEGNTPRAILQYVEDHDVDLVVLGTHGRAGLGRLVVGSVAETVVRESPVPVVTVRAD